MQKPILSLFKGTTKNSHYYSLFRGSKKWICPCCGRKTFVCYVDSGNNVLDLSVGKCDRADKCGYHKPPKEYFDEHGDTFKATRKKPKPIYKPKPPTSYIDKEVLKKSVEATYTHYNNLITFLNGVFGMETVGKMIADYYIGTASHWHGSTVFWQVDAYGNVRTGKIMQYNPINGKRVKTADGKGRITWAHKVMRMPDFNLKQCLFGEHLLKRQPSSTVVIVESEKTAIIASAMFADCITLACGGCGNLSEEKCAPLRGRDVVLLPDNGKFGEWSEKGKRLRHLFKRLRIADIMEREGTPQGNDIGDLIVERYQQFCEQIAGQDTDRLNIDLGLHEIEF